MVTRLKPIYSEVDCSSIVEISKFNYLLELAKDKPKDDILGLPHTEDGYHDAKRILKQNYGKDSKVQKALIKDPQTSQYTRVLQQAFQRSAHAHHDKKGDDRSEYGLYTDG